MQKQAKIDPVGAMMAIAKESINVSSTSGMGKMLMDESSVLYKDMTPQDIHKFILEVTPVYDRLNPVMRTHVHDVIQYVIDLFVDGYGVAVMKSSLFSAVQGHGRLLFIIEQAASARLAALNRTDQAYNHHLTS